MPVIMAQNNHFRKMIAIAIALILLLSACDTGPQAPRPTPVFDGTIKVGVAAPYTGDTADGGIQIWQGAQLAADQVNASGGILGKKVEIVPADDAADPKRAITVAKTLVSDGIVAVV